MLTQEHIERLALLARLELSPAEVAAYRQDLEKILAYVGELQKIDTIGVRPLDNVLLLQNALRTDAPALRDQQMAERLIAAVPEKRNGYIVVPRVLYHG